MTCSNSSVCSSPGFNLKSFIARSLTASNSGDCVISGLTYVYNAPFTSRGPRVSREALWESAGVGKAGSGGRFEVKTLDLGRSRKVKLEDVPFVAALLSLLR